MQIFTLWVKISITICTCLECHTEVYAYQHINIYFFFIKIKEKKKRKTKQQTTKQLKPPCNFIFIIFTEIWKINSSVFLWFEWCRYTHGNISICQYHSPFFPLINDTFSSHSLEFIWRRTLYLFVIIIRIADLGSSKNIIPCLRGPRKIATYFFLTLQWNAELT